MSRRDGGKHNEEDLVRALDARKIKKNSTIYLVSLLLIRRYCTMKHDKMMTSNN
jgi:hypothetical protein